MLKRALSLVLVVVISGSLFACGGKVIERTGSEALGMLQWKIDKTEKTKNIAGENVILIHYVAEINEEYKNKYSLKEIKYASCDENFVIETNLSKNKFVLRFREGNGERSDGVKFNYLWYKNSAHEDATRGIGFSNGSLDKFEKELNTYFPINSNAHRDIEPPNYINDIRVEFIEK